MSNRHRDVLQYKILTMTSTEKHHLQSHGPRRRSSALRFFTSGSPPKHEGHAPSQKDWEAQYLNNLRTQRPSRPGGSRPLPSRAAGMTPEPYARAASALSFSPGDSLQQASIPKPALQERAASALSNRCAPSDMPNMDIDQLPTSRPLTQPAHKRRFTRDFSTSTSATVSEPNVKPPFAYRESGMRWMEKQEARSLREALEHIDLCGEAKPHAVGQGDVSRTVGQGRNMTLPHKDYNEHLKKGAHARSQSHQWYEKASTATDHSSEPRSASGQSSGSSGNDNASEETAATSISSGPVENIGRGQHDKANVHIKWDSPGKKAYTSLAFEASFAKRGRRRSSLAAKARRATSGPFSNPDDKIYEEGDGSGPDGKANPEKSSRIPVPLMSKPRGSVSNVFPVRQPSNNPTMNKPSWMNRSEIHRNPPSQSRDPSYVNKSLPPAPFATQQEPAESGPAEKSEVKDKEIRSDELRAATSMRFHDRSPNLPSPAFISDKPGRHIVSFNKDWRPKPQNEEVEASARPAAEDHRRSPFKPPMPSSTASAPVIPTINISDAPSITVDSSPGKPEIPSISVSTDAIPTISLPDDGPKSRPLPATGAKARPAQRPLPHHSATTPSQGLNHQWNSASQRGCAQCAACALPIAGRIVSAASQRFHPHCFTCHHCAEPLECVAFYPEPEGKRAERLERIQARLNGEDLPEDKAGETAVDDGDDSLRFFCHLDYHELYSPRCRSCKTPIEKEVVLACGGSWHVGHFFCAECGDPFDAQTPFVEKDGYAWCIKCHAGRFSGKCKGCRKPVVEQGISALGAEWHEACFVCIVSTCSVCANLILELTKPS